MTRLLRWLTGFVLAVLIAAFAVFNRQPVSIAWSPVHPPLDIPLYAAALGFLGIGFLWGALSVWLNDLALRCEKQRQKKQITALEQKLEKRQEDSGPSGRVLLPALRPSSK